MIHRYMPSQLHKQDVIKLKKKKICKLRAMDGSSDTSSSVGRKQRLLSTLNYLTCNRRKQKRARNCLLVCRSRKNFGLFVSKYI